MNRRHRLVLFAGSILLALTPLAGTAVAGVAVEADPQAVETHGWICVTHYDPYFHTCIP